MLSAASACALRNNIKVCAVQAQLTITSAHLHNNALAASDKSTTIGSLRIRLNYEALTVSSAYHYNAEFESKVFCNSFVEGFQ